MTAPLDALIVGAGPAGLIAADHLSAAGRTVVVIDRMPSPGRKLLMAGRSGLNLTHADDADTFLSRYGAARARLEPAIRAFPPEAVRAWAAGLGVETFVGSSGRVFPREMKASPLLRALLTRLRSRGVELRQRTRFAGLCDTGIRIETGPGETSILTARTVLLAMGGASWPRLGSDAGWVPSLAAEGIAITPFTPANAGVRIDWTAQFRDRFHGEPLKRLAVTFAGETVRGEAVVTRSGLEGGGIYPLSARIGTACAAGTPVTIHLDLRPDLTAGDLTARLAAARAGDSLANRLRKAGNLPPVAAALLREATGNTIPTGPQALAGLIKSVPLTVTGVNGLERAISSAGGIGWAALTDDFMLAARPGVFAAGEMIDWDAPTGGYLLQACLSTGRAAAEGMLRHLSG